MGMYHPHLEIRGRPEHQYKLEYMSLVMSDEKKDGSTGLRMLRTRIKATCFHNHVAVNGLKLENVIFLPTCFSSTSTPCIKSS